MNLEELVKRVLAEHPDGLRHPDIVALVRRAGYAEPHKDLSKDVYAIVKDLMARDEVTRQDDEDTLHRWYLPKSA